MSDKTELLPCFMPDCGSTLVGTGMLPCGVATVSCGHCGVSVPSPDADAAKAIERWNRRATIQPTAAEPVAWMMRATDPELEGDCYFTTDHKAVPFGVSGIEITPLAPVAPAAPAPDWKELYTETLGELLICKDKLANGPLRAAVGLGAPDDAVRDARDWISVADRMPDVGDLVMVYSPPTKYDHPGEVNIGFDCMDPDADEPSWLNHNEHYEHFCCVAKPEGSIGPSAEAPYTHWMPLPAAPTETPKEPAK